MPSASDRGKSGKTDKKLGGSKTASNETPVSSKENPDPANPKTGNTSSTRPVAQTQGAKGPSTKSGAKAGDHTEATGRDHPSQSEHAKALYQKLHGTSDQKNRGGPPGANKKGGFDPKQVRGGKGNFGGGHNQMLRRTQSRGGGGGGGGGGGQV